VGTLLVLMAFFLVNLATYYTKVGRLIPCLQPMSRGTTSCTTLTTARPRYAGPKGLFALPLQDIHNTTVTPRTLIFSFSSATALQHRRGLPRLFWLRLLW